MLSCFPKFTVCSALIDSKLLNPYLAASSACGPAPGHTATFSSAFDPHHRQLSSDVSIVTRQGYHIWCFPLVRAGRCISPPPPSPLPKAFFHAKKRVSMLAGLFHVAG